MEVVIQKAFFNVKLKKKPIDTIFSTREMTRLTAKYEHYLYHQELPPGSWKDSKQLWENLIKKTIAWPEKQPIVTICFKFMSSCSALQTGASTFLYRVRYLRISSKIRFESLYRVAVNGLTMKAEISIFVFTRKLEFCLPDFLESGMLVFFLFSRYFLNIVVKTRSNSVIF